jgi:AraC-like DNA-binding protein
MKHQVILPPKHLQNYVRFFWTIDCNDITNEKTLLKIFACRFPRLVFQHNNGNSALTNDAEKLPLAFLSGINIKPYSTEMDGTFSLTGVSFFPHALKSIFGIDSNEVCDGFPELTNFIPADFVERVLEEQCHSVRIDLLINYLTQKISNTLFRDTFILKSLKHLSFKKENESVFALQKYFKVSERHLERKFKSIMGLTPKQYLRVERFERAFDLMQDSVGIKLSDIAYDLNYTDQSHFIKDFKELSGFNPKEFIQKEKLLEESSSIVIKKAG